MKPVNSDLENNFHRESEHGIDAVFKRMLKATGKTFGFSYAEAFDVSPNTLKTWRKRGQVSLKFLQGFASEYGVSLDYLLGRNVSQSASPQPALTARQEQAGYIVEVLSKEEQALLDNYRHAPEAGKRVAEAAIAAVAEQGKIKRSK